MQTNVKQYKEEIYAQVRKYMVKSDEKQHNAGQLSFLKGLFVSNLAIAAPVKVRHAENILDHLKHTIFNLPAADLRLMFDQKKNIESFIDSAYGEELSKIPGDWEVNEEECLPFLLIQEAQAKMEQALLYYIAAKKEKEWAIIEEEKEKEEARKKNRDFLELLYSTALYEIFLREFEIRLPQSHWL